MRGPEPWQRALPSALLSGMVDDILGRCYIMYQKRAAERIVSYAKHSGMEIFDRDFCGGLGGSGYYVVYF
jgi:hypothetical protein